MNLKEYFARAGSHFSDQDAQVIGPELERLGDSRADEIVNAARSEHSPLHPYFEWDDSIAAEEYRKRQARNMAAAIVVKVVDRRGQPQEVRAFHAVRIEQKPNVNIIEEATTPKHYVPVDKVRNDEELSEQVIAEAKRQLTGWMARYNAYRSLFPAFEQELGQVFEVLNKLENGQVEMVAS